MELGDPAAAPRTVFVGGLDGNCTETDIKSAFLPFGDISSVSLPFDVSTKKNKGYAFVIFEEEEDAHSAIDNMNNAEFFGRVLRVNIAKGSKLRPIPGRAAWSDMDAWQKQAPNEKLTPDEEREFVESARKLESSLMSK